MSTIRKKTPIVALIANAVMGAREKMMAVGMDDFLDKPIIISKAEKYFKKYLKI